ncbi:MAG: MFS transporter [Anaerolineae bacterium]|nr:MFS transporter [Anaerolineae bacterium]
MLSLLIWALGEGLWINFRQLYLEQLGASPSQIGLALSIESIARAIPLLPAGYLIDRIGARQVMIASWLIGIGGPLIGGLAMTWQGFVPGMVIYALSGFAAPAISAYSLRCIPEENVSAHSQQVLTIIYAAFPAGLVIAPTLGGLVAEELSIRACLWLAVILSGLSTIIVLMTHHVAPHPQMEDRRATGLLRNHAFISMAFFYMITMLPAYTGFAMLPNFLQNIRGFTYQIVGMLFSILPIGTVFINLFAGRINARWGLTLVLSAIWIAFLGIWQISPLAGVGIAFFALGGIYSLRVVATAGLAQVVQTHNQGMAFSLLELLFALSMAAAARAAGELYALTSHHDLPLIIALVLLPVLIGAWLVLRLPRQQAIDAGESVLSKEAAR